MNLSELKGTLERESSDTMSDALKYIFFTNNFKKKSVTPMKYLVEQKCPTCKRVITDFSEVDAFVEDGLCINCDHILGELAELREVDYSELDADGERI